MDRFLTRKRPKEQTNSPAVEDTAAKKTKTPWPTKTRKYEAAYIKYGFTATRKNGCDCPKCVLCPETLSKDCLKPSKLQRHLIKKHPAEAEKTVDFFRRKEEHLVRQSPAFTQQATVPEWAMKASFLASYHIARAKKPHTIGEDLILPATKDISENCLVRMLLGKSTLSHSLITP